MPFLKCVAWKADCLTGQLPKQLDKFAWAWLHHDDLELLQGALRFCKNVYAKDRGEVSHDMFAQGND